MNGPIRDRGEIKSLIGLWCWYDYENCPLFFPTVCPFVRPLRHSLHPAGHALRSTTSVGTTENCVLIEQTDVPWEHEPLNRGHAGHVGLLVRCNSLNVPPLWHGVMWPAEGAKDSVDSSFPDRKQTAVPELSTRSHIYNLQLFTLQKSNLFLIIDDNQ